MVRHINEIARRLGARITGRMPQTGGGAFGAARAALHGAPSSKNNAGLGFLGMMCDAPEELDAIVEDAMRNRRMDALRPSPENFAALERLAEATGRPANALLDEALGLLFEEYIPHAKEGTCSPAPTQAGKPG